MPMTMELLIDVVKIVTVLFVMLTLTAYLTLAERKFSAFMQDRKGPNLVSIPLVGKIPLIGPFLTRIGFWQPLVDGIKFIFKEDVIPTQVHRPLYIIAPALLLVPAIVAYAVIPFGDYLEIGGRRIFLQIADVDMGILYILAVTGLAVYSVFIAGWASNNKYSLLGGLRSSAQMISYELTLGLAIVGALMYFGTVNLREIAMAQMDYWRVDWLGGLPVPQWGIFIQPLGFLLFLVSAFAESNRLPFDLVEAETELVGGFHTEYGSMKFAMFFMGEYIGMTTMSALLTLFFFGAWHIPGIEFLNLSHNVEALLGLGAFAIKTGFFLFLFIWVRWTLPRFRYDQLMKLSWRYIFPLALLNIFLTGFFLYFTKS